MGRRDATELAPVLRRILAVRRASRRDSLKRLDFCMGHARAFTTIPADFAGSRVRLCRAEGKPCH